MKRGDLDDLAAFAVVAEHGSFTRAAAQLGMTQSALSHAMKVLETRLGVRLLSRTTRSVATTEAGETLLRSLRPALEDIATGLRAAGALGERPSGTLRITATKHAALTVLMPALPKFHEACPEVRVELITEDALTDIVANRFDAGIRFGELVEKDMIAIRIGPDLEMAVVGTPDYLARHPPPKSPRELAAHRCISYWNARSGGIMPWEFEAKGRPLEVRPEGTLVFNDGDLILEAALAGRGLGYVFEDTASAHLAAGRLVRVLARWCPPFPGYYLYHSSRRHTPPALAALVGVLRDAARAGSRHS